MTAPTAHLRRGRVASIAPPRAEAPDGPGLRMPSAAAPPPAPAKATPMRADALATTLNSKLTEAEIEAGPQKKVNDAASRIHTNLDNAKKVGVDATRKSFWTKVLGASVAALALAVVISLSVATGGAPLAAAVAIASVVLMVSVADACCAHMNLRNAQAHANNKAIPHRLPMGDSSIANLVYMACPKGMKHGTAKGIARFIDNTLRLGMMLAGGLCTAGASVAANSFEHIAPLVAGAVNVLSLLVNITSTWGSNATYAKHVEDIKQAYHALRTEVINLPESQRPEMLALIESSERDAMPEIEAMRGAVPRRAQVLPRSLLSLGWIVSGVLATLMPGMTLSDIRMMGGGQQTFTAPITGSVGGVGTARFAAETLQAPQDDGPGIEAVRAHLQRKFNPGDARAMSYEEMMADARGNIAELHGGLEPSVEYLHYILKKAIDQLKAPDAEPGRLAGAIHLLKEEIRQQELIKPAAPKAQVLEVPTEAIAQDLVAPPPKREDQVNDLLASMNIDLELQLAANNPAAFIDELQKSSGQVLAKSHQAEDHAARRDLAVDALGKLLADRKINVNEARHIMAGLPHEDLVAIEFRIPHTKISNIAHICVMLEKVRAGEGEAKSASD